MDKEAKQFADAVAKGVVAGLRHMSRQSVSLTPVEPDIEDYKLKHRIDAKVHHNKSEQEIAFAEGLRQLAQSDAYYAGLSEKAAREIQCLEIQGRLDELREKRAAYGDDLAKDWGVPVEIIRTLPNLALTSDWKLGQLREQYGQLSINGALEDVKAVRTLDGQIAAVEAELAEVVPPAQKLATERDQKLAAAKAERKRLRPASVG